MFWPVAHDDLARWRECRDCGLYQREPTIPDGEAAFCVRCSAMLRRAARDSVNFARLSAVFAAILFLLSLSLPVVDLRTLGRLSSSTLFSGPDMLRKQGLPGLALVILFTLIVVPASKLSAELIVLFGARAQQPPAWLRSLFGWLERLTPWAMVEVFLLGSFVAYSRLRDMAHVDVGTGLVALGGVMLCMVATDATLDREAVWEELDKRTAPIAPHSTLPLPPREPASAITLIGCDACRWVMHAHEGDRCARCGHELRRRKTNSLRRAWALVIAAALLYIPANFLPVMTIERLGRGGPTTIFHGVIELAQQRLWPLALLVLLASIVVPMVKLVSLTGMLVMTHRRSATWLRARTRMFRFVQMIGRWSMIDIFMLSILVGVVRLGSIATVLPGDGAGAFCAVVILTMIATEVFDPRLMWDAGVGARELAPATGVKS